MPPATECAEPRQLGDFRHGRPGASLMRRIMRGRGMGPWPFWAQLFLANGIANLATGVGSGSGHAMVGALSLSLPRTARRPLDSGRGGAQP